MAPCEISDRVRQYRDAVERESERQRAWSRGFNAGAEAMLEHLLKEIDGWIEGRAASADAKEQA